MLTYKEFENDIRECFKDVINKYSLKLISNLEQEGWFILKSKKFEISFSFDRGELFCLIKISKNNYLDISKFIRDHEIQYPNDIDFWNPRELLPFYSKVFIDYDLPETQIDRKSNNEVL